MFPAFAFFFHHSLPPLSLYLNNDSLIDALKTPTLQAQSSMAAGNISPFFNKSPSLFFLLLLHLGCFLIFSSNNNNNKRHPPTRKKRKPSLPSPSLSPSRLKPNKAWSYLKTIFSISKTLKASASRTNNSSSNSIRFTSARSSNHRIHYSDMSAADHNPFFPLLNDIFPCTACGEIFQKPHLLEQHQALKHAVSELIDGDSGKNIVHIIFKTGWSNKEKTPEIHRILKIHNSSKILSRFEEYREFVKSKAARNGAVRKRDERCIADGNELLRFHCSTFVCGLGQNGNSSICNQMYCSVCGIIKSGFSPKLDGISTLSSSWGAHMAIPEDVEEEFKFMSVKRAMLVCRVVAGRVGRDGGGDVGVGKESVGFDSVVGRGAGGPHQRVDDDEELLAFNPRAVLPCFVIVYTV